MLAQFRARNKCVVGSTNRCSPQSLMVLNVRAGSAVTKIHGQNYLGALFDYC
jgi:hypothetical protein